MCVANLLRPSAMIAAGLLAVAATSPARAAGGMMGAFHVCYVSKAMPGAVGMALNLVVVTPKKTMSGEVTMTQAVNPPLHVQLPVKGSYRDVAKGRHVAKLASPKMPGRHIAIAMTATGDWEAAVASYDLWLDTPQPPKKGKVSLRQEPCK
jgi:Domain of unknown function (DUF1842)